MKHYLNLLIYYIHKLLKKLRLSGVRDSFIHQTSALESGTSFIKSTLDKHSFCGYDCDVFMADIGMYCSIANGVVIGGAVHPVEWVSTSPVFYNNVDSISKKYSRHERDLPVKTVVGNDVWIGRNAMIKQGVTIGTGAVIGMGAIVTKNVEPYSIVAGNPAKEIRSRFDNDIIELLLKSEWWDCDDLELTTAASMVKDPVKFANAVLEFKSVDKN